MVEPYKNALEILGRHMRKWKSKHTCYPVIVGGTTVNRCLGPTKYAKEFNKGDIDMPFVLTDPRRLKRALRMRARFLGRVMKDLRISGLNVTLNDNAVYNKRLRTHKLLLISIYLVNDDDGTKKVLIDCPIYAPWTVEDYGVYAQTKGLEDKMVMPIPYYVDKKTGVMYATCNFVYYDTVRMMMWYRNALVEGRTRSRRETEFATAKYIKYMNKFSVLYMVLKKHKDSKRQMRRIKTLYAKTKQALNASEMKSSEQLLRKLTDLSAVDRSIKRAMLLKTKKKM